uniref:(California timema) hypothetical protein n=1 Tax=Timema californicum TaxID=61474 RepID=A0A7R9PAY8_TIMCA|nr:unnamed protein product [Timema californicum]
MLGRGKGRARDMFLAETGPKYNGGSRLGRKWSRMNMSLLGRREVFENFQDTSSWASCNDNRTDVSSLSTSQETQRRDCRSVLNNLTRFGLTLIVRSVEAARIRHMQSANALVVLSCSTAEDGEIEVRILVGSSEGVTSTRPLPVECVLEDIYNPDDIKRLPNPPMIREIPLPVKSQHEYKMYEIESKAWRTNSVALLFTPDQNSKPDITVIDGLVYGERPFACPECPYSFNVKSNLNKHIERHSKIEDGPFACDDCGKVFENKKSLVNHMRHHLSEASLWCRECGKYFTYKKVYTRHVFTVHTVKKTNNRRKKPRR